MNTITVQSRITKELKQQADSVLSGMGMSVAEAIRIFLQQCVNNGGLPFQPTSKIPNQETLAAFQEIETGKTTKTSLQQLRKNMGLDEV